MSFAIDTEFHQFGVTFSVKFLEYWQITDVFRRTKFELDASQTEYIYENFEQTWMISDDMRRKLLLF